MEKKQSYMDVYKNVLCDKTNWSSFEKAPSYLEIEELFLEYHSKKFIDSYFLLNNQESISSIFNQKKISLSKDRLNHTVSAYLLGIAIRDALHFDMRNLPHVDKSIKGNFLYFWSLICLFHDFTFVLEENSEDLISNCRTFQDFKQYFGLEFDIPKKAADWKLIQNYYRYRVDTDNKIDHGIACAFILYDVLMREFMIAKKEGKKKASSYHYQGKSYSERFEGHCLLIALTIAKHNMWRSNASTAVAYKEYELDELIPDAQGTHLISFDDKDDDDKRKMLFLMGMVDTIEPLKCMGRAYCQHRIVDPYVTLRSIEVKFTYSERSIQFFGAKDILQDYYTSIQPISEWMNIEVSETDSVVMLKIKKREE